MNVEELSMIGPNVDLETVDSINKKRLLAFVNHYVVNTTLFLNKLSKSYEYGLMSLENKIQKLENSIVMLESKLSSVPGLDDIDDGVSYDVGNENHSLEPKSSEKEQKQENVEAKIVEGEVKDIDEGENEKTSETLDPALMKYVKMLQFGVPPPAVKLKMEQENVSSSLHDLVLNYNK